MNVEHVLSTNVTNPLDANINYVYGGDEDDYF